MKGYSSCDWIQCFVAAISVLPHPPPTTSPCLRILLRPFIPPFSIARDPAAALPPTLCLRILHLGPNSTPKPGKFPDGDFFPLTSPLLFHPYFTSSFHLHGLQHARVNHVLLRHRTTLNHDANSEAGRVLCVIDLSRDEEGESGCEPLFEQHAYFTSRVDLTSERRHTEIVFSTECSEGVPFGFTHHRSWLNDRLEVECDVDFFSQLVEIGSLDISCWL